MDENNKFALVARPPGALEKVESGAQRILSGMVADTLALSPKEKVASPAVRSRIGDYELCEPDYRQVVIWADHLSLEPVQVIKHLFNGSSLFRTGRQLTLLPEFEGTAIEKGRFINLNWDWELLPLKHFKWVQGLEIMRLRLVCSPDRSDALTEFAPLLPRLTHLICNRFGLEQLDLSGTPNLAELDCSENRINRLQFSVLPNLSKLKCYGNSLADLELTKLPALESLSCGRNDLTELDLPSAPRLWSLACHSNQISKLNFSKCRRLRRLWCHENHLSDLSLRSLDELNLLDCSYNELERLDLSCLRKLTSLKCSDNRLAELDLHGVPALRELQCGGNQIASLDLREVRGLTRRFCRDNRIETLDISPVLSLKEVDYDDDKTQLIQRPDQHF